MKFEDKPLSHKYRWCRAKGGCGCLGCANGSITEEQWKEFVVTNAPSDIHRVLSLLETVTQGVRTVCVRGEWLDPLDYVRREYNKLMKREFLNTIDRQSK